MSAQASTRINVAVPVSLLEELKEFVPSRERSRFIVTLIEKEVRRRQFEQALRESAGAWADEDHPALNTVDDVNRYVRDLRAASMPQSWDELAGEGQTE
jgi:hypothetical protein